MAKNTKSKIQEVVEKKEYKAKPKSSDYSLFSNISPKANASTQTPSNKKLLKPILHSLGLTLGKSIPASFIKV